MTESSSASFAPGEIRKQDALDLHTRHRGQVSVEWPSPKTAGQWVVSALPWVGQIPVNDGLLLVLEPKVPLQNLFGMLEYAYCLRSFRFTGGEVQVSSLAEFYERLAVILCRRVLDRERKGLYREYVSENDRLPYLRGRLDL